MLICPNAEGVHGQRKVGNHWSKQVASNAKIAHCLKISKTTILCHKPMTIYKLHSI